MSQLFPSCFFTRASPFLPSNSPTMPTASPISGSPCGQSLIPYNLVSSISRFSISIFTLFLFSILQISISKSCLSSQNLPSCSYSSSCLSSCLTSWPKEFTRIFSRIMKKVEERRPGRLTIHLLKCIITHCPDGHTRALQPKNSPSNSFRWVLGKTRPPTGP